MKNILVLITAMVAGIQTYAQDPVFYQITWKVKSLNTILKDKEVLYYHKDSTHNLLDYSKVEFNFSTDGSYEGANNLGAPSGGTFVLRSSLDSAEIDGVTFHVVSLNAQSFIVRGYSLEPVDDLGTTDTAYTYLSLYPAEVVTHSLTGAGVNAFKVYPNPADNIMTIEKGKAEFLMKEIKVLTIYGQEVFSISAKGQELININIADLSEGIYFVQILDEDDQVVGIQKITKKR